MSADTPDDLEIPDFLKRVDEPKSPKPEVVVMPRMSDDAVEAETEAAVVETPRKAAKAKAKPNGATHKAVKAAKAPAKAKATPKPAKAKAKAKVEAAEKDKWGFRDGSLKSKAAALYAAKKGATLEEVKEALGSVQLNLLKDLEAKGHKVKKVKEDGEGKRKVTRYFLS